MDVNVDDIAKHFFSVTNAAPVRPQHGNGVFSDERTGARAATPSHLRPLSTSANLERNRAEARDPSASAQAGAVYGDALSCSSSTVFLSSAALNGSVRDSGSRRGGAGARPLQPQRASGEPLLSSASREAPPSLGLSGFSSPTFSRSASPKASASRQHGGRSRHVPASQQRRTGASPLPDRGHSSGSEASGGCVGAVADVLLSTDAEFVFPSQGGTAAAAATNTAPSSPSWIPLMSAEDQRLCLPPLLAYFTNTNALDFAAQSRYQDAVRHLTKSPHTSDVHKRKGSRQAPCGTDEYIHANTTDVSGNGHGATDEATALAGGGDRREEAADGHRHPRDQARHDETEPDATATRGGGGGTHDLGSYALANDLVLNARLSILDFNNRNRLGGNVSAIRVAGATEARETSSSSSLSGSFSDSEEGAAARGEDVPVGTSGARHLSEEDDDVAEDVDATMETELEDATSQRLFTSAYMQHLSETAARLRRGSSAAAGMSFSAAMGPEDVEESGADMEDGDKTASFASRATTPTDAARPRLSRSRRARNAASRAFVTLRRSSVSGDGSGSFLSDSALPFVFANYARPSLNYTAQSYEGLPRPFQKGLDALSTMADHYNGQSHATTNFMFSVAAATAGGGSSTPGTHTEPSGGYGAGQTAATTTTTIGGGGGFPAASTAAYMRRGEGQLQGNPAALAEASPPDMPPEGTELEEGVLRLDVNGSPVISSTLSTGEASSPVRGAPLPGADATVASSLGALTQGGSPAALQASINKLIQRLVQRGDWEVALHVVMATMPWRLAAPCDRLTIGFNHIRSCLPTAKLTVATMAMEAWGSLHAIRASSSDYVRIGRELLSMVVNYVSNGTTYAEYLTGVTIVRHVAAWRTLYYKGILEERLPELLLALWRLLCRDGVPRTLRELTAAALQDLLTFAMERHHVVLVQNLVANAVNLLFIASAAHSAAEAEEAATAGAGVRPDDAEDELLFDVSQPSGEDMEAVAPEQITLPPPAIRDGANPCSNAARHAVRPPRSPGEGTPPLTFRDDSGQDSLRAASRSTPVGCRRQSPSPAAPGPATTTTTTATNASADRGAPGKRASLWRSVKNVVKGLVSRSPARASRSEAAPSTMAPAGRPSVSATALLSDPAMASAPGSWGSSLTANAAAALQAPPRRFGDTPEGSCLDDVVFPGHASPLWQPQGMYAPLAYGLAKPMDTAGPFHTNAEGGATAAAPHAPASGTRGLPPWMALPSQATPSPSVQSRELLSPASAVPPTAFQRHLLALLRPAVEQVAAPTRARAFATTTRTPPPAQDFPTLVLSSASLTARGLAGQSGAPYAYHGSSLHASMNPLLLPPSRSRTLGPTVDPYPWARRGGGSHPFLRHSSFSYPNLSAAAMTSHPLGTTPAARFAAALLDGDAPRTMETAVAAATLTLGAFFSAWREAGKGDWPVKAPDTSVGDGRLSGTPLPKMRTPPQLRTERGATGVPGSAAAEGKMQSPPMCRTTAAMAERGGPANGWTEQMDERGEAPEMPCFQLNEDGDDSDAREPNDDLQRIGVAGAQRQGDEQPLNLPALVIPTNDATTLSGLRNPVPTNAQGGIVTQRTAASHDRTASDCVAIMTPSSSTPVSAHAPLLRFVSDAEGESVATASVPPTSPVTAPSAAGAMINSRTDTPTTHAALSAPLGHGGLGQVTRASLLPHHSSAHNLVGLHADDADEADEGAEWRSLAKESTNAYLPWLRSYTGADRGEKTQGTMGHGGSFAPSADVLPAPTRHSPARTGSSAPLEEREEALSTGVELPTSETAVQQVAPPLCEPSRRSSTLPSSDVKEGDVRATVACAEAVRGGNPLSASTRDGGGALLSESGSRVPSAVLTELASSGLLGHTRTFADATVGARTDFCTPTTATLEVLSSEGGTASSRDGGAAAGERFPRRVAATAEPEAGTAGESHQCTADPCGDSMPEPPSPPITQMHLEYFIPRYIVFSILDLCVPSASTATMNGSVTSSGSTHVGGTGAAATTTRVESTCACDTWSEESHVLLERLLPLLVQYYGEFLSVNSLVALLPRTFNRAMRDVKRKDGRNQIIDRKDAADRLQGAQQASPTGVGGGPNAATPASPAPASPVDVLPDRAGRRVMSPSFPASATSPATVLHLHTHTAAGAPLHPTEPRTFPQTSTVTNAGLPRGALRATEQVHEQESPSASEEPASQVSLLTAGMLLSSMADLQPNVFEHLFVTKVYPLLYHSIRHGTATHNPLAFPVLSLLVYNFPTAACRHRCAGLVEQLVYEGLQAPFTAELTAVTASLCSVYHRLRQPAQALLLHRIVEVLADPREDDGPAAAATSVQGTDPNFFHGPSSPNARSLRGGRGAGDRTFESSFPSLAAGGGKLHHEGALSRHPKPSAIHDKLLCFRVLQLFRYSWKGTAFYFLEVCAPYFTHRDPRLRRASVQVCVSLLLSDCFRNGSGSGPFVPCRSCQLAPGTGVVLAPPSTVMTRGAMMGDRRPPRGHSSMASLACGGGRGMATLSSSRGSIAGAPSFAYLLPSLLSITPTPITGAAAGTGIHRGRTHVSILRDVLHRLVEVAISDPEEAIRCIALRSMTAETYQLLYPHENIINGLFVALNDRNLPNRVQAVRILRQLAPSNPPMIYPRLRTVLLQQLSDFMGIITGEARLTARQRRQQQQQQQRQRQPRALDQRQPLRHAGPLAPGGGSGAAVSSGVIRAEDLGLLTEATKAVNRSIPLYLSRILLVLQHVLRSPHSEREAVMTALSLLTFLNEDSARGSWLLFEPFVALVGRQLTIRDGDTRRMLAALGALQSILQSSEATGYNYDDLQRLIGSLHSLLYQKPSIGAEFSLAILKLLGTISSIEPLHLRDAHEVPALLGRPENVYPIPDLGLHLSLFSSSPAAGSATFMAHSPPQGRPQPPAAPAWQGSIAAAWPSHQGQRHGAQGHASSQAFARGATAFMSDSAATAGRSGMTSSEMADRYPYGADRQPSARKVGAMGPDTPLAAVSLYLEPDRFSQFSPVLWPDVVVTVLIRTVSDFLNATTSFTPEGLCECLHAIMRILSETDALVRLELYLPTVLEIATNILRNPAFARVAEAVRPLFFSSLERLVTRAGRRVAVMYPLLQQFLVRNWDASSPTLVVHACGLLRALATTLPELLHEHAEVWLTRLLSVLLEYHSWHQADSAMFSSSLSTMQTAVVREMAAGVRGNGSPMPPGSPNMRAGRAFPSRAVPSPGADDLSGRDPAAHSPPVSPSTNTSPTAANEQGAESARQSFSIVTVYFTVTITLHCLRPLASPSAAQMVSVNLSHCFLESNLDRMHTVQTPQPFPSSRTGDGGHAERATTAGAQGQSTRAGLEGATSAAETTPADTVPDLMANDTETLVATANRLIARVLLDYMTACDLAPIATALIKNCLSRLRVLAEAHRLGLAHVMRREVAEETYRERAALRRTRDSPPVAVSGTVKRDNSPQVQPSRAVLEHRLRDLRQSLEGGACSRRLDEDWWGCDSPLVRVAFESADVYRHVRRFFPFKDVDFSWETFAEMDLLACMLYAVAVSSSGQAATDHTLVMTRYMHHRFGAEAFAPGATYAQAMAYMLRCATSAFYHVTVVTHRDSESVLEVFESPTQITDLTTPAQPSDGAAYATPAERRSGGHANGTETHTAAATTHNRSDLEAKKPGSASHTHSHFTVQTSGAPSVASLGVAADSPPASHGPTAQGAPATHLTTNMGPSTEPIPLSFHIFTDEAMHGGSAVSYATGGGGNSLYNTSGSSLTNGSVSRRANTGSFHRAIESSSPSPLTSMPSSATAHPNTPFTSPLRAYGMEVATMGTSRTARTHAIGSLRFDGTPPAVRGSGADGSLEASTDAVEAMPHRSPHTAQDAEELQEETPLPLAPMPAPSGAAAPPPIGSLTSQWSGTETVLTGYAGSANETPAGSPTLHTYDAVQHHRPRHGLRRVHTALPSSFRTPPGNAALPHATAAGDGCRGAPHHQEQLQQSGVGEGVNPHLYDAPLCADGVCADEDAARTSQRPPPHHAWRVTGGHDTDAAGGAVSSATVMSVTHTTSDLGMSALRWGGVGASFRCEEAAFRHQGEAGLTIDGDGGDSEETDVAPDPLAVDPALAQFQAHRLLGPGEWKQWFELLCMGFFESSRELSVQACEPLIKQHKHSLIYSDILPVAFLSHLLAQEDSVIGAWLMAFHAFGEFHHRVPQAIAAEFARLAHFIRLYSPTIFSEYVNRAFVDVYVSADYVAELAHRALNPAMAIIYLEESLLRAFSWSRIACLMDVTDDLSSEMERSAVVYDPRVRHAFLHFNPATPLSGVSAMQTPFPSPSHVSNAAARAKGDASMQPAHPTNTRGSPRAGSKGHWQAIVDTTGSSWPALPEHTTSSLDGEHEMAEVRAMERAKGHVDPVLLEFLGWNRDAILGYLAPYPWLIPARGSGRGKRTLEDGSYLLAPQAMRHHGDTHPSWHEATRRTDAPLVAENILGAIRSSLRILDFNGVLALWEKVKNNPFVYALPAPHTLPESLAKRFSVNTAIKSQDCRDDDANKEVHRAASSMPVFGKGNHADTAMAGPNANASTRTAVAVVGPAPASIARYAGLAAEALSRWSVVKEATDYADQAKRSALRYQRLVVEDHRRGSTATAFASAGSWSAFHYPSEKEEGATLPQQEQPQSRGVRQEQSSATTTATAAFWYDSQDTTLGSFSAANAEDAEDPLQRQLGVFRGAALVATYQYDEAKRVLAQVRKSLKNAYAVFHTENTRAKLELNCMFQQIAELEEGIHAIELTTVGRSGQRNGGTTIHDDDGAGGDDDLLPSGGGLNAMENEVRGRIYRDATVRRLRNIACRTLPVSSTVMHRFATIAVRSALVPPHWQIGNIFILSEQIEREGMPMRAVETLGHFASLQYPTIDVRAARSFREQLRVEGYRRLVRSLGQPQALAEVYRAITAELRHNIAMHSAGAMHAFYVREEASPALLPLPCILKTRLTMMISEMELGVSPLSPYQVELLLLSVTCRRRLRNVKAAVTAAQADRDATAGVASGSFGDPCGSAARGMSSPASPISPTLAKRFPTASGGTTTPTTVPPTAAPDGVGTFPSGPWEAEATTTATAAVAAADTDEDAPSPFAESGTGGGFVYEGDDLTDESAMLAEYYLLEHTISVTQYNPAAWREFGLLLFDVCEAMYQEWDTTQDTDTLVNFQLQSVKAIQALQQAAQLWRSAAQTAIGGLGPFATTSHRRQRHARSVLPTSHLVTKAMHLATRSNAAAKVLRHQHLTAVVAAATASEGGHGGTSEPAVTPSSDEVPAAQTTTTTAAAATSAPPVYTEANYGFASLDFTPAMYVHWAMLAPMTVQAATKYPAVHAAVEDMCARSRLMLHQFIFHLIASFEHSYNTLFPQRVRQVGSPVPCHGSHHAASHARGHSPYRRGGNAADVAPVSDPGSWGSLSQSASPHLPSVADADWSQSAATHYWDYSHSSTAAPDPFSGSRSTLRAFSAGGGGAAMTPLGSTGQLYEWSSAAADGEYGPGQSPMSDDLSPPPHHQHHHHHAHGSSDNVPVEGPNRRDARAAVTRQRSGGFYNLPSQQRRWTTPASLMLNRLSRVSPYHAEVIKGTMLFASFVRDEMPASLPLAAGPPNVVPSSHSAHDNTRAPFSSPPRSPQQPPQPKFSTGANRPPPPPPPAPRPPPRGHVRSHQHLRMRPSSDRELIFRGDALGFGGVGGGGCMLPAPTWMLPPTIGSEDDVSSSSAARGGSGKGQPSVGDGAVGGKHSGRAEAGGATDAGAGTRMTGMAAAATAAHDSVHEASAAGLKRVLRVHRRAVETPAPQFSREEIFILSLSDGYDIRFHYGQEVDSAADKASHVHVSSPILSAATSPAGSVSTSAPYFVTPLSLMETSISCLIGQMPLLHLRRPLVLPVSLHMFLTSLPDRPPRDRRTQGKRQHELQQQHMLTTAQDMYTDPSAMSVSGSAARATTAGTVTAFSLTSLSHYAPPSSLYYLHTEYESHVRRQEAAASALAVMEGAEEASATASHTESAKAAVKRGAQAKLPHQHKAHSSTPPSSFTSATAAATAAAADALARSEARQRRRHAQNARAYQEVLATAFDTGDTAPLRRLIEHRLSTRPERWPTGRVGQQHHFAYLSSLPRPLEQLQALLRTLHAMEAEHQARRKALEQQYSAETSVITTAPPSPMPSFTPSPSPPPPPAPSSSAQRASGPTRPTVSLRIDTVLASSDAATRPASDHGRGSAKVCQTMGSLAEVLAAEEAQYRQQCRLALLRAEAPRHAPALKEAFTSLVDDPARWLAKRRVYSEELAEWSVVQFLLDIHHREAGSFFVDTSSGHVGTHLVGRYAMQPNSQRRADGNPVAETQTRSGVSSSSFALARSPFPTTDPSLFRLTRSLVSALPVESPYNTFRSHMAHCLYATSDFVRDLSGIAAYSYDNLTAFAFVTETPSAYHGSGSGGGEGSLTGVAPSMTGPRPVSTAPAPFSALPRLFDAASLRVKLAYEMPLVCLPQVDQEVRASVLRDLRAARRRDEAGLYACLQAVAEAKEAKEAQSDPSQPETEEGGADPELEASASTSRIQEDDHTDQPPPPPNEQKHETAGDAEEEEEAEDEPETSETFSVPSTAYDIAAKLIQSATAEANLLGSADAPHSWARWAPHW